MKRRHITSLLLEEFIKIPVFSHVCVFFYPVNLHKGVVELERIIGIPYEIFYDVRIQDVF